MPTTISHYRIEGEIGHGGMGVVYRAVDTRLGRAVAIKMLPAGMTADAERRRRFVQEARAASALNHPNIVTIHEIDSEGDVTFLAMELIEGTPLDRLLAAGPLPIATALDYARQIAAALAAAHFSGIVHRDIKPANIMVTRDGYVKVLDFGLAKLVELSPTDATAAGVTTRAGVVMGTAAYMSPEQAQGSSVDGRSDIFSFGAVLYEMLAGRRPFSGSSDLDVITSILRDAPPSLRGVRGDVPSIVTGIVERCLSKDRAARYENGAALKRDLDAASLYRTRDAIWRRPPVVAVASLLVVALAGAFGWRTVQARRGREARLQAIPRIEELMRGPRSLEAYRLARQIETDAPDEVAQLRRGWLNLFITTNPDGATVEFKNYSDVDGAWEPLGTTPIRGVRAPFSYYRYRIVKTGFVTREIAGLLVPETIDLRPESATPPGMIPIRGGPFSYLGAGRTVLPDYWLDKYEVTNRDFKTFVNAGGYRDPKYWKEAFVDNGRTLSFAEAMARFRDTTGRPGPSTWESGDIPEGQEDFPAGGISWFEAAAFAAFKDKSLPTVFHWMRAAGVDGTSSEILRLSNFNGKHAERVGARPGMTQPGAFDMAGNVKEWCANAADGARRYTLGAAWTEPSYRFAETDAQNPWERGGTFGVRLIKNLGPAADAERPIATAYPDPKTLVPVGDAEFAAYTRFYSYDRLALDIRLESVDDSAADYRKEIVSYAAAYGGERISASLFLPRNAKPPYQTIVLFPSAFARLAPSSRYLDFESFGFLIKSGRALLYPVYKDTFERRTAPEPTGPSAERDRQVSWGKDFFRSVDYLATRDDIDMQRLGYYSVSMGAFFAPIPLALEPRIKVAVLLAGGLRYNYPPEIQPANFMPRVKIPVLTINGRDDFSASPGAQDRVIELLGTPPEHKKHVALEGGHLPTDWRGTIREVLDWYDKYLGPVK